MELQHAGFHYHLCLLWTGQVRARVGHVSQAIVELDHNVVDVVDAFPILAAMVRKEVRCTANRRKAHQHDLANVDRWPPDRSSPDAPPDHYQFESFMHETSCRVLSLTYILICTLFSYKHLFCFLLPKMSLMYEHVILPSFE